MALGRFSDDGREYIINRPDLSRPWFNYITNEQYGMSVSQTADGLSIFPLIEGTVINRSKIHDILGRCFYIREEESGETWSINWEPVKAKFESFECRHGLGYTIITSKANGIQGSVRFFVDPENPVEWWTLKITNTTERTRRLKLYPFIEWHLGNALTISDESSWYSRADFEAESNAIVVRVDDPSPQHPGFYQKAFMASGSPVDGFCCSRKTFLGGKGNYASPEALKSKRLNSTNADAENIIGCIQYNMELNPGETKTIEIAIGMDHSEDRELGMLKKLSNDKWPSEVEKRFELNNRFWNAVINDMEVKTPDSSFDRWINIWARYQLYQIIRWIGGGGANNPINGYRDVLQYSMGIAPFVPSKSKQNIIEAAGYQYSSGRAPRAWSRKGRHDTRDYRDSPVWLIFALNDYLRISGDFGILHEKAGFLDGGEASILEHALRAIKTLSEDRGEHGLSRIGEGDWLDPLNRCGIQGKGESVWLSMAVHIALKQMADIASATGLDAESHGFLKEASELKNAVNNTGWDGQWYRRAYDDNGSAIGSKQCTEGKIFLNPQSWAIISGIADNERAEAALSAVEDNLKTPYGYLMFTPEYSAFRANIGGLSVLRLKNMVYLHSNLFKIIADCKMGRGTSAYETFKMIDPNNPEHPPEESLSEPHIIPNGYFSAPGRPGRVCYSGFTGTVPWIFKYVIEELFGLKVDYKGITVDPCIPEYWQHCSIRQKIRGTEYCLTIKNPEHVSKGVISLIVEGNKINGNYLSFKKDADTCKITCYLGKENIMK